MAGDIVAHMPLVADAWNGEAYDFTHLFADARRYYEAAAVSYTHLDVYKRQQARTFGSAMPQSWSARAFRCPAVSAAETIL